MDCGNEYVKMCNCAEIQKDVPAISTFSWYGENKTSLFWNGDKVYITNGNKWVWLPRQDQLQEMVKRHPTRFAEDFNRFVCEEKIAWLNDSTMEQLWLAFVMFELYHKKWSNGEWIRNS